MIFDRKTKKKVERLEQDVRDAGISRRTKIEFLSNPPISQGGGGGFSQALYQVRSAATPLGNTSFAAIKSGLYNCIKVNIDKWNGSGINDDKVIDVDQQYDSDTRLYPEWDASTTYLTGNVVEIKTVYNQSNANGTEDIDVLRTYRALAENTNRNPATNPEVWLDITVEVLNLPEAIRGKQSAAILKDPKLIQFDLITASTTSDIDGTPRVVGRDNIGNTRLFVTTGNIDSYTSNFTASAVTDLEGYNVVTSGSLNYNIDIRQIGIGFAYDFTSVATEILMTWYNGAWHLSEVNPAFFGNGITESSNIISAKVDNATIDFNGSGEIRIKP